MDNLYQYCVNIKIWVLANDPDHAREIIDTEMIDFVNGDNSAVAYSIDDAELEDFTY